jgi:hypothetical protein
MPVQVAEMPKSNRGRKSKYDFSQVYDGKVWILTRGTQEEVDAGKADFTCKPGSLRQTIYRDALEQGHKLSTRNAEHEGREAVAVKRVGPAEQKSDTNGGEKSKPQDKAGK